MPRKTLRLRLLPSLIISAFLMLGSLSSCGTQNEQEPIVKQTIAKESKPLDSSTTPKADSKNKSSKNTSKEKKPVKVISYGKNEPVTI